MGNTSGLPMSSSSVGGASNQTTNEQQHRRHKSSRQSSHSLKRKQQAKERSNRQKSKGSDDQLHQTSNATTINRLTSKSEKDVKDTSTSSSSDAGKRFGTRVKQATSSASSGDLLPRTTTDTTNKKPPTNEGRDPLIGGNVANVRGGVRNQQKQRQERGSTPEDVHFDGILPPLVKPTSAASSSRISSTITTGDAKLSSAISRHGAAITANDDCDETRAAAPVNAALNTNTIDATNNNNMKVEDENRRLKSDSQQAKQQQYLSRAKLVSDDAVKTTPTPTSSNTTKSFQDTSINQIRASSGRDKSSLLVNQKVGVLPTTTTTGSSSKQLATTTTTTTTSSGKNRNKAKKAPILSKSSSVLQASMITNSAGGNLASSSSMRAMMMLGNSNSQIKQQQQTMMMLTGSSSLNFLQYQPRFNLVQEDQKQRVRNWLESQPFTEFQQSLEMVERWTRGQEELSDLTMLNETITSKTNKDTDHNHHHHYQQQQDYTKQQASATTTTTTTKDHGKGDELGDDQLASLASSSRKEQEQLAAEKNETIEVQEESMTAGGTGAVDSERGSVVRGGSISGGSIESKFPISLINRNRVIRGPSNDHNDNNNKIRKDEQSSCRSGSRLNSADNNKSKTAEPNGKSTGLVVHQTGSQPLTMTIGPKSKANNELNEERQQQEIRSRQQIGGGGTEGYCGDGVDLQSSLGETVAPDIDDDEIVDDEERCSSMDVAGSSSGSNSNQLVGKEKETKCLAEQGHDVVGGGRGINDSNMKAVAADMQMIDFKKDDCSLCHYLESLKAVVASGPDDGNTLATTSAATAGGVCRHQQHQTNKGKHGSGCDGGTSSCSGDSGKVAGDILAVAQAPALWSDIKLNRHELECEAELKLSDGLVAVCKTVSSAENDEEEDGDEDDDNDVNNVNDNDGDEVEVSLSDELRPSSAHSRLCPQDNDEDQNGRHSDSQDDSNKDREKQLTSPVTKHLDSYQIEKDLDVDEDEVPSTEPPLPPSQMRTTANKNPVQRGLSLDANNNNNSNNKQQLSSYKRQMRKMNSKQCLSNKYKSQSSKLIVISSNSVSYTIQVASEDPSNYDDLLKQNNLKSTNSSNNKSVDNKSDKFRVDTNSNAASKNSKGLVDIRHIRKEGEFKTLNRIDSCKKFLVKKISGPNPRAARLKRKQPNHPTNRQILTTPPPIEKALTREQTPTTSQHHHQQQHKHCISGGETSVRQQNDEEDWETSRLAKNTMDDTSNPLDQGGELTPRADAQERGLMSLSPESSAAERVASRSYRDSESRKTIELERPRMNFEEPEANVSDSQFVDETSRTCNIAAKRLRELVAHLEHGSVPQSVLYQTLEYAASVLDSVTMDQISRVSDEEDGDLSEVQSDAVPNEVRKWLETTFTRNSISQKRKSEDKLKFRSVANAIRAGIVVDRIYRRMSASTPFVSAEVSNLLKSIDDWSFDCFSINQVSNGQVLKSVGYELFNRYGLMYKFKIPTTVLKNFLTQIEMGYVKHKNPYHNNLHAADVTQTVHYMLWQAGLTNWLTDLEIFATLLAAIIHDYLHTGTTNNFHVMSQSDTALIYNDRAVLENFHICQAFTLMRNEDCNILAGLSKDEYREFRSLVIDMVLATDMSSHFQQIKAMKNILNHSDNFNADKSKILSLVIHISDISHPAKEWELHSTWTQLLMEEFFRQGDREKELSLECSPLCDRETTLVAESQLGFIEFIVSPSLEVCGDVLDRVLYQMAEANARPVLPASAKAASVVAASGSSSGNQQQAAIEAAPQSPQQQQTAEPSKEEQPRPSSKASGGDKRHPENRSNSGSVTTNSPTTTAATTTTQSSTSFVSSETLTSNLRKMIVSSSATIGRKLNISGSGGGHSSSASSSSSSAISQQQLASNKNNQQPSPPPPPASRPASQPASEPKQVAAVLAKAVINDFEARQANYKHPVIQCDSSSARPKSSDPRVRHQRSSDMRHDNVEDVSPNTGGSTDLVTLDQAKQQSSNRLSQPTEGGGSSSKRTNTALATCSGSTTCRSAGQLQSNKIQRPWIKCLDRNKKMWQERAVIDAQARELKERLKQQQEIESAETETTLKQVED